jgi:hypothetical protein
MKLPLSLWPIFLAACGGAPFTAGQTSDVDRSDSQTATAPPDSSDTSETEASSSTDGGASRGDTGPFFVLTSSEGGTEPADSSSVVPSDSGDSSDAIEAGVPCLSYCATPSSTDGTCSFCVDQYDTSLMNLGACTSAQAESGINMTGPCSSYRCQSLEVGSSCEVL